MRNAHKFRSIVLLTALVASDLASAAQDIGISEVEHFTENRSWNDAGLGPMYQTVLTAVVVPSGYPTLVYAEQSGVRQPFSHIDHPSTPNAYVYWQRFDAALTGSWRIVAQRGEAREASVWTSVLAKPQQVPFVRQIRVTGTGTSPRLNWALPDLTGFDIDRIRIGVRGGKRIQGRYLGLLYVSSDLPPTATTFTIPAGVLARGERYIFQVMLEDLERGRLENRSLTFSEPYVVSP